MIEKVIKVGSGLGPVIHTERYTNVSVRISGLTDGDVMVLTPHKDHRVSGDTELSLGDVGSVQVWAKTKCCAIVKLRAEAA